MRTGMTMDDDPALSALEDYLHGAMAYVLTGRVVARRHRGVVQMTWPFSHVARMTFQHGRL